MSEVKAVAGVAAVEREMVGLEEYYTEAGADYAAWSEVYNMHFGFYRMGMNPFDRESMLEQMNVEVMHKLRLTGDAAARVLDMGCGLGATLRSLAKRLPHAELTGITRVPWQVGRGTELNAGCERIRLVEGDYERMAFEDGSMDAVYAVESSCYARGADKRFLIEEAYRVLRPGGRIVVADGFLRRESGLHGPQRAIFRKLCECWVIETLGDLELFVRELERVGFQEIEAENIQLRVAPSTLHIPWVTAKFLVTDVLMGRRKMTRARWNNVLAPLLLPMVSEPLGPMAYYMVSATKG